MADIIKTLRFRIDSSPNWKTFNPVPANGEQCIEYLGNELFKLKIGDGISPWIALAYADVATIYSQLGDLSKLTTVNKQTAVDAINEIVETTVKKDILGEDTAVKDILFELDEEGVLHVTKTVFSFLDGSQESFTDRFVFVTEEELTTKLSKKVDKDIIGDEYIVQDLRFEYSADDGALYWNKKLLRLLDSDRQEFSGLIDMVTHQELENIDCGEFIDAEYDLWDGGSITNRYITLDGGNISNLNIIYIDGGTI
jgi:hypothetical protein